MQGHMFLSWPGKNLQLSWKFWFIHCIHQTLHLWISSYFQSLQNNLNLNGKKCQFPGRLKRYPEQFLLKKIKKFWKDGIMKLPDKWQKIVEYNGTLFNKVLGENEKCTFYFYLKKNQRKFLASPKIHNTKYILTLFLTLITNLVTGLLPYIRPNLYQVWWVLLAFFS